MDVKIKLKGLQANFSVVNINLCNNKLSTLLLRKDDADLGL